MAINIGFIGPGIMGGPMAHNLIKSGHKLWVYARRPEAMQSLVAAGATACTTAAEAARQADVIFTIVSDTPDVESVIFGDNGIAKGARSGSVIVDMSTISPTATKVFAERLSKQGVEMLDAPVSGGVGGAAGGTLTFMVGGSTQAFTRAESILQKMGKTIVHAGGAGTGQAAKICNNMVLGISMIAVSEAFVLAEKLGLDHQKLFDISSKSSGQCWSMTSYCPVPGPVPASPANRDYQAGFTAAMMLKDLRLAQQAAGSTAAVTPMGAAAANLFQMFVDDGAGPRDFSGIYRFLRKH